ITVTCHLQVNGVVIQTTPSSEIFNIGEMPGSIYASSLCKGSSAATTIGNSVSSFRAELSLLLDVTSIMRKLAKSLLIACCVYLLLAIAAGVVVGEACLKLVRRPLRHRQEAAAMARERYHASLQEVSIAAADGVELKGWYIHP